MSLFKFILKRLFIAQTLDSYTGPIYLYVAFEKSQ